MLFSLFIIHKRSFLRGTLYLITLTLIVLCTYPIGLTSFKCFFRLIYLMVIYYHMLSELSTYFLEFFRYFSLNSY